ncbi:MULTISPECIES: hypothetical protein [Prauserella salsuginis group]|uniref:Phytoene synthase n=1 Tax=Prauserella salsuginis TaxID=387889 RepID=A0ABW6GB08_9PSEU|nr:MULTISPECIES: hypothetical protein [Prauserella salsuginis group]MCR3722360.1 hypothetical protein [Prauserella flava]MCR3736802.1 hypothetical protein [Prauserella salsuginis]
MAEHITDAYVVSVLRPYVRATGPLVDALREKDPFSVLAREAEDPVIDEPRVRDRLLHGLNAMKLPGTAAWTDMDTEARTKWWTGRVGRFTSLLAAVPGIAGAVSDLLPVQDTIGAAGQGLLLCALAGERGHTDVATRVRLIAWVLFERDIPAELAEGRNADRDAEDAETERLTEELDGERSARGKASLKTVARTLWHLGRSLQEIPDELEKRPSGRFYHKAFGLLPGIGMAADYLGERSGLKRVAKRADKWFAAHPAPAAGRGDVPPGRD